MAMLPFCGYNMADYFGHWLTLGEHADASKLPRVFYVNWFRKDEDGKFMWPGYGENSRVLEWIFRRCEGEAEAHETPLGLVPHAGDLNIDGLDLDASTLEALITVDEAAVSAELPQIEAHLATFGADLPEPVRAQFEALKERLGAAV